jgi:prefoldin beta subunit
LKAAESGKASEDAFSRRFAFVINVGLSTSHKVKEMVSQDEVQQLLMQAQLYQQQMQSIMTQKETLKVQQLEIKKALEEMEKSAEAHVYKASGPILIKSPKEDVKKDLADKDEFIKTRLQTLERSEKKVKEKIDELREKLSKE